MTYCDMTTTLPNQQLGEIILYQPDEIVRLERLRVGGLCPGMVRLEDDTVWLNRQQLAELFGRDVKTIGKHVNNALKEELKDISVIAKFATTARDGKTYQVDYYNLLHKGSDLVYSSSKESLQVQILLYGLDHVQQVCEKINELKE